MGGLYQRIYLWENLLSSLFYWFITENLITEFVSVSIDILLQVWSFKDSTNKIIINSVFILLKIMLIWVIVIKCWNPTTWLSYLFNGIHPSWISIYYAHMIIYRLGLMILVILSDWISLKYNILLLLSF